MFKTKYTYLARYRKVDWNHFTLPGISMSKTKYVTINIHANTDKTAKVKAVNKQGQFRTLVSLKKL